MASLRWNILRLPKIVSKTILSEDLFIVIELVV